MKMRRFKNEKMNKLPEIQKVFKNEVVEEGIKTKLTIYGDIGESWWGDSISAADIKRALETITTNKLDVHINSYGGDVFDGIAIYNQLKNHNAEVTVYIDGVAASAASLIAMAGNEVIVNIGGQIMIHEASTYAWGNKGEIQKTLNALESIDKSIADIYMTRFAGERSEIETMIVNETWFTANEAVEVGLADKVNEVVYESQVDPEEFKNNVLARFRNQKQTVTNSNILAKLKRNSNE